MPDSVGDLIEVMESDLHRLRADDDPRRYFHEVYLRTTRAVVAEIDRGGFLDADWLRRWDLSFAGFYLDALAADSRGEPVAEPWRVAFDTARDRPDLPPLRHVLLGMNAHINFDLPQALIDVISPGEFDDPAVRASREADHRHIDDVLSARVDADDTELSRPSRLDRLLAPVNRAATKRFLTESRAKVWHNIGVLDSARRVGPERYTEVLDQLSALSTARLLELVRPGQVLIRLARHGFGVRLPADG